MQRNNTAKKYSRVYVEITNVCNMSCSFCPGTKRPPAFMSMSEFGTVLDRLSGITEYLYFHLMGEPTLYPELLEFIRLARGRGYHPMITTNGTMLSTLGEEIVAAGIYKVNISLHSFEKNDGQGQKSYLSGCVNFAKLAASRGVIVTLRLWNGGTDADNGPVLEFLRESFSFPWEKNNRGERLSDKIFLEYADRFAWPDADGEPLGRSVYCHGLSDHFGVLVDGTVIPCCLDREGVINLGNIYEDSIEKILSSERAKAILSGFKKRCATEELCRKCGYARRF